jgi:5-methylcytosine-specific restriction endonuclease McrA
VYPISFADIEAALQELNAKYPSCSTCQFRGNRTAKAKGKKVPVATAWCEKHRRPVEYNWSNYADDRGRPQRMVIGDVPCEEYTYQHRPVSLFCHAGRKDDRVVEKS